MKYALAQTIFYLLNNKIHSARVLSRVCVENDKEDLISNSAQDDFFARFGNTGVTYATCHGEIAESDAFASKEDLAKSLTA